jgi:hypothetical protein
MRSVDECYQVKGGDGGMVAPSPRAQAQATKRLEGIRIASVPLGTRFTVAVTEAVAIY